MNREKNLGLPEEPSLFCEFHGISKNILLETADLAKEVCEECGAVGFDFETEEGARKNLWRARHEAWETIHRAHPKKQILIVDAAVPISRYPEIVVFSQKIIDEYRAIGYVFGHAGDGNLHVVMVGDPADTVEWQRLEAVNHAIVEKAVQVGGTCTGEHGESYHLMRQIKETIDPKWLMNPGKIF